MKGLLFLARLALICNAFFLVCLIMQRTPHYIEREGTASIVIILGWLLAPFVNLAANIWYLTRLMRKRLINLPFWLAITNFLFLLLQVFYHFILPS
jgi:hypothetical protein